MEIGISRELHDKLLNKMVMNKNNKPINAIAYMIKKYKHQWSIAGCWFYGVACDDINILDINK